MGEKSIKKEGKKPLRTLSKVQVKKNVSESNNDSDNGNEDWNHKKSFGYILGEDLVINVIYR